MTAAQRFFDLVEKHVTPPMLTMGYAKIGEYDGLGTGLGVPLVAVGPGGTRLPGPIARWWKRRTTPRVQVLQVGYELQFGEDDERWIGYIPDTGELDVSSWRDTLEGYADWDVWNDRFLATDAELEHRIRVLGVALGAGNSR